MKHLQTFESLMMLVQPQEDPSNYVITEDYLYGLEAYKKILATGFALCKEKSSFYTPKNQAFPTQITNFAFSPQGKKNLYPVIEFKPNGNIYYIYFDKKNWQNIYKEIRDLIPSQRKKYEKGELVRPLFRERFSNLLLGVANYLENEVDKIMNTHKNLPVVSKEFSFCFIPNVKFFPVINIGEIQYEGYPKIVQSNHRIYLDEYFLAEEDKIQRHINNYEIEETPEEIFDYYYSSCPIFSTVFTVKYDPAWINPEGIFIEGHLSGVLFDLAEEHNNEEPKRFNFDPQIMADHVKEVKGVIDVSFEQRLKN